MLAGDIPRKDVIILLASMGIVLDAGTKIPLDMLEKRLDQGLDTSQHFEHLVPETLLDPDALPKCSSNEPLFHSTRRHNLAESVEGSMFHPKLADLASKDDTFKEMRQTLNCIAHACDMHYKDILLLDFRQQRGIFMRILGVHNIKNDVPLFLFVYKELVPTSSASMQDILDLFQSNEDSRATVPISELESYALLRLFQKNSKRLHPKHQALIDDKGGKKFQMHVSFLLPLNPLNQRSVGSLSDSGCYVCGKRTSSICQGCMSVSYCGKECQVADWKAHKPTCRSLKGGSWKVITLGDLPGSNLNMPYTSLINWNDPLHKSSPPPPINEGSPLNTHNGKIFLAKFQVTLTFNGARPSTMLVYDRQRTLQRYWFRNNGPTQLFDEATDIIGERLKFYRWLRHISSNQYEICLDRAPRQDPPW